MMYVLIFHKKHRIVDFNQQKELYCTGLNLKNSMDRSLLQRKNIQITEQQGSFQTQMEPFISTSSKIYLAAQLTGAVV